MQILPTSFLFRLSELFEKVFGPIKNQMIGKDTVEEEFNMIADKIQASNNEAELKEGFRFIECFYQRYRSIEKITQVSMMQGQLMQVWMKRRDELVEHARNSF